MKLKSLWAMLMLFVGMTANAAITSGYYRIISYNNKYLTENISENTLICSDLLSGNYAQVWYINVSGSNVTIKNALTDRYVEASSTYYQQWATTTASHTFSMTESNNVYNFYINANSGLWGIHCDNNNVVVGYFTNDNKSNWTVEAFTMDATATAALNAQKTALAKATNAQLTNFFTSTACTELKDKYKSYSDSHLRSSMSSLPTTVQDMAIKVKNGSWTTYSGWDKTERTFRIADYKAYSNSVRWREILGLKHILAQLENPTGIYVEQGDYLQIYVGDIPAGQSIKLATAKYGSGGYGGPAIVTYNLNTGMNVIQVTDEGNCFIIYEVDNTTNGSAPYTALSSYADVTVHIEGGTVQGYFDLTKGDDNSDWTHFVSNLMTKDMFCLKSNTLVFNLKTDLIKTAVDGGDGSGSRGEVVEMLEYWQGIQDMEDELFGRSSFGGENYEYCNNVYTVTSIGNDGAGLLYAYSNGIYFSPEQHNRLFNNKQFREGSDNLWASAHELGHHRQNAINMVGNTEVSNNIFSNVAVYQQGRYTSRTANIQDVFQDYQNGLSWPERVYLSNTGSYNQHLLRLNWQLYLYFHVLGKKTDFFPSLFNALRADPMTSVSGENTLTPASTDYLHYYVKCCEASGYDLTEFFASFGFFMLPPEQSTSITYNNVTTNRYQTFVDYATYNLYVTQEMIDAAKAEVAAMNLPKCNNIVFIEDRVTAPLATYDGHAEGELKLSNPASVAIGSVGETGQYTDFNKACSDYYFNVDDKGNVTVEGTGAVGFKVYDSSGNLRGFYNTNSFTLPANIGSGYTIKASAGDGTDITLAHDAAISIVEQFPKTDTWYTFCTPLRGNHYMKSTGSGVGVVGDNSNVITNAMMWKFVLRDNILKTYDIINRNDGSYLNPSATYNTQITTSAEQPSAGWTIKPAATSGMYIISSGSVQLNQTTYQNTPIYNYGLGNNISDDGCQYTITEREPIHYGTFSTTALPELDGYNVSVSTTYANDLTTGKWYVMFNRGVNYRDDSYWYHGYLYERTNTHTLYNIGTIPSGSTATECKYLVRLIDAGDGTYYIQNGYGNYFGQIAHNGVVPTIATPTERITVAKINNTDGHFYLQDATTEVILDANDLSSGTDNATVVGWSTTVPTKINGNNDWAFYPVTLTRDIALHAVGGKSYATLYFDRAVTTDSDTKAYYIASVSESHAQLTAVGGEGHNIPAYTAVVLINDNAANSTSISTTDNLANVVTAQDNLLKGTLTGLSLDLSTSTPYYTLGQLNSEAGFYKYLNNSSSILHLAANRAYLCFSAASNAKGFTILWDEATGISTTESSQRPTDNDGWYTLSGVRISKPTKRGIYIHNGKKVVVK